MDKSYTSKFKLIVKVLTLLLVLTVSKSWGQILIPNTTPIIENFDGMGTASVTPTNWKMHQSATPTWAGGTTALNFQFSAGAPGTGGSYNWGTSSTERALGVMTSGSYVSPNSVLSFYKNTNTLNLTQLTVSYDLERYRRNTAAASVQFFYSLDGSTWIAVTTGDIAAATIGTGASLYGYTQAVFPVASFNITGLNIATNGNIYLRWNLNTTGSSSQGIGIDNVNIIAAFTAGCTAPSDPSAITAVSNPACSTATLSAMSGAVSPVVWYWQGSNATGTSTTQSTATDYTTSTSGTYYVRAYDGTCWSSASSSLAVTVNTQPSITTQPANKTVCVGSSTTFSIVTSGTSPSYQWQVNDGLGGGYVNVSTGLYTGGTTAILTLTNTTSSMNSYSYQCVVSVAACSSTTTNPGLLTVVSIPAAPPTPSIIATCNTAVISETVVATPPAGVTWYWASNATSPVSYTSAVNDYSATSSGTVYIRAKSDIGTCWNSTVTTNSVAVTVTKSPTITTQPTSSLICQGTAATVKVSMSASSTTLITYQWQENTGSGFTNISNGSPYTISVGTYTSTLGIDGTKPIGTYTYQCIISNSCGTVTTSIVTVTITATPANDLCSNASPIVIDAAPIIGNLNCAGPTAGLTYNPSKNDVWYTFTPTCTASHAVTMTFTTSGADYDLDVFSTASCPSSGSAAGTSHGTSTVETVSQTFTSGVTYYVRVIDYNTSGGTFTIGVVSNCGTPHTVIFDSNGGTGSMSNQTANSATNLTSNAFTNSGCSFVNWNDSANANGTSYPNSAVYSFTADVILYAQWSCSSGGGSAGCPYLVSAVVNACAGSCGAEGRNEMVVMNSGNYAIPVNGTNVNLYYSGGTNHYFTNSFAVSQGTVVSNLNTLAATSGCTNTPFTFVSSGSTIPANSTFMILNNNSCFSGDFSAYCNAGPIYVIISTDADWESNGYFGNNNNPRYFRTDFSNVNSGCGLTTYNYNNPSTFAFNTDGASVTFNGTTASYITGNGSCAPNIDILPIELVDFYATKNNDKNDVVWKVASEENVVYYTLDKSNDGVNFTELATVFSNNASQRITYSVVDDIPFDDITYYRLGTKENDGKVYYHKIISVDEKSSDWNSIQYQQEQNLVIEFKNAVPKNSIISLFDLSGKQMAEVAVKESQTTINTQTFAGGIYFLKIVTPYKTENFKIIITK